MKSYKIIEGIIMGLIIGSVVALCSLFHLKQASAFDTIGWNYGGYYTNGGYDPCPVGTSCIFNSPIKATSITTNTITATTYYNLPQSIAGSASYITSGTGVYVTATSTGINSVGNTNITGTTYLLQSGTTPTWSVISGSQSGLWMTYGTLQSPIWEVGGLIYGDLAIATLPLTVPVYIGAANGSNGEIILGSAQFGDPNNILIEDGSKESSIQLFGLGISMSSNGSFITQSAQGISMSSHDPVNLFAGGYMSITSLQSITMTANVNGNPGVSLIPQGYDSTLINGITTVTMGIGCTNTLYHVSVNYDETTPGSVFGILNIVKATGTTFTITSYTVAGAINTTDNGSIEGIVTCQ